MDYSGHIGIIGGGIAGLTLGCSLLKEGIPAVIFEKSPEETSHGAAISLSSNALCLLSRLEIYEDLSHDSFLHSDASIQGPKKFICENNHTYSINHLVGGDGIRSSIRDLFFSSNQDPKYSGYSAWRGIGRSNLKSVNFALGPGSHVVSYPVNKKGDVSFVAVKKFS